MGQPVKTGFSLVSICSSPNMSGTGVRTTGAQEPGVAVRTSILHLVRNGSHSISKCPSDCSLRVNHALKAELLLEEVLTQMWGAGTQLVSS